MNDNFRTLRPYLRGFPIIIIFLVVAVTVAKTYLKYTTVLYESTAKLKLADIDEGVPSNNLFKEMDVFSNKSKILTEIEVVKSPLLVNRVIKDLALDIEIHRVGKLKSVELYDNSPFRIKFYNVKKEVQDKEFELYLINKNFYELTIPTTKEKISGELGDIIRTDVGTFFIYLNDSLVKMNPNLQIKDNYTFKIISSEKVYSNVIKNLTVAPVEEDVPVLRISYKNSNPAKAAKIVNRLAQAYIDDYIETKYRAAHLTVKFLDNQIDKTLIHIANSENDIEGYRDSMRITNIIQETETDLRKVSELKIQQTNLKMSLEAIRELEKYVKEGKNRFLELAPNFEAFTDLLSTEIIKKIKDLQAEKKDLLLVYTRNDERVKVIDKKIEDLTSYLIESIGNTRKNLEIKSIKLAKDIQVAESAFIGVPEKERILGDLNREFNIYQQTYNFLNEKKIEAEIAAAAKIAFHKIISPGEIPSDPVSPNKPIITIVAGMLGMFAAILIIFIVHQIKAKVNDVYTVETNSSIPVALLTPKLFTAREIERYFLKEAIELDIKGLAAKDSILCFSAFKRGEGADFNAFYLAKAFLSQGRKVLLIDADNQYKYFFDTDRKDVIHKDGIDIMTLTNHEYLSYTKTKMEEFIHSFKKQYDLIILLNENLEHESKGKLVMALATINFVVIDARLTSKKRVSEAEMLKDEYGFPNMYFILNRYDYVPSLWKEFKLLRKS